MNKKTTQTVIVIVCLVAAVAILAYSMGFFGGGPKAKGPGGSRGPQITPAQSSDSK